MDAKNIVIITLSNDEAQRLLNTIDKLNDHYPEGKEKRNLPDITTLLKLADALETALKID